MEFPTIEIDEKNMISEKGDFESCHDVVMYDDQISKDFLDEEQGDNILLIRKFGDMYKVDCYSRTSLKEIIKPRVDPPYLSKNCKKVNGTYQTFYPISIGGVECFFTLESILAMIRSFHQIYYVEPKVNDNQINCQGRMNTIYEVKVCGGENCLPQIFREDDEEVLYESDDEAQDEEDDEDEFDEDEEKLEQADNFSNDFRQAIDSNNMGLFGDTLMQVETYYGYGGIEEFFNEIDLLVNNEPILIYAIKQGRWNMVKRMIGEGASLEVGYEGITPLVSLVMSTDRNDFVEGLMTLFELDDDFSGSDRDIVYFIDKNISIGDNEFTDIFDFIDRYPDISDRNFKSRILREAKSANLVDNE